MTSSKDQLIGLPHRKRLLFAALTCEKLYPQYGFFYRLEKWGNPEVLDDILRVLYNLALDNYTLSPEKVDALQASLSTITPDPDDFSSVPGTFAVDICCAFEEALFYMVDRDVDHLVNVATIATDIVDMFVQEKENIEPGDPQLEEKIEADAFMKAELNRQQQLIDTLAALEDLTEPVVSRLREEHRRTPIIDLSLIREE